MTEVFNMRFIIHFVSYPSLIILLFCFIIFCAGENVKKSVDDNRFDNVETNDEAKEESLDLPAESDTNITCTRRSRSQMHEIQVAEHKQFPFMAAIMSHQNEYLCAGSVVSNGLILTTAQCSLLPVAYALLNATKAKKDDTTVSVHVRSSEKFPTFDGGDVTKNVALLHTEKMNNTITSKIKLSNYTNFKNIVDFEAIGFGLNADVGQTKELQFIGVENRAAFELGEVIRGYFDCIDTKVVTCFKDTGGPVIFDNELVGLVIKGQEVCSNEITSAYAINKKIVDAIPTYTFKAWLDEKIKKNEVQESPPLMDYPMKPVVREPLIHHHQMTNSVQRCILSDHIVIGTLYLFYKYC